MPSDNAAICPLHKTRRPLYAPFTFRIRFNFFIFNPLKPTFDTPFQEGRTILFFNKAGSLNAINILI